MRALLLWHKRKLPKGVVAATATPGAPSTMSDRKNPGRTPDAVREARIQQIYSLVVQGLHPRDIWRFVAERTDWGISRHTLERYLSVVDARLEETSQVVRARELGKAILRYDQIYSKAMTAGNLRTALLAQKAMSELLGLDAPVRVGVGQDPDAGPVEIDDRSILHFADAVRRRSDSTLGGEE